MRNLLRTALLLAGSFHAGIAVSQTLPSVGPAPVNMPPGMPVMQTMAETQYVAMLEISDGKVIKAGEGGHGGSSATGTSASGLTLQSDRDAHNGIIIHGGRSAYTLGNSRISLSGTGKNDFLGIGAGVMARDNAALVIDKVTVTTNGAISPAVVAAEGATVRIYDSRFIANGGKLPANYKPIIGPGMMEPPAPLGLNGDARTLLAMSNSRTYLYNSYIEANGWGALSTDQAGGQLYLEANDCVLVVRNRGYGTYADIGAHVVINRGQIDSGAYGGIIAGAARLDLNGVKGSAHDSLIMIHSVMGFDPAETGTLTLSGVAMKSGGPLLLVKSANADISINGGSLSSNAGILLQVRKNEDANATKVDGKAVPGVRLAITKGDLRGDIIDTDPERKTYLDLRQSKLAGALNGVTFAADKDSRWTARANSEIWLETSVDPGVIDAPAGVVVRLHPPVRAGGPPDKEFKLPGGGRILIVD